MTTVAEQCQIEYEGFVFSSEFDSGNCCNVTKCEKRHPVLGKADYAFTIHTHADPQSQYHTWFHFSMKKLTTTQQKTAGDPPAVVATSTARRARVKSLKDDNSNTVTCLFAIHVMNEHKKLFEQGMKPVYKFTGDSEYQRIPLGCSFSPTLRILYFIHRFTVNQLSQPTYFAFTFPYSYEQCNAYISRELSIHSADNSSILFESKVVGHSDEGRPLPMIMITDKQGNISSRKQVFVSARVHPGETPSSYVMEGLLQFLTSADERAKILRREFVFYAVPILNPDGVVRGYYRTDTHGVNLNRMYHGTQGNDAISRVLKFVSTLTRLYLYVDMHAHASKRGCFVYGNCLPSYEEQVKNVTWSKLFALNTQFVNFNGGNFAESRMNSSDLHGKSRDGTGRVGVYNVTGIARCYTLECNYNSGKTVNRMCPMGGDSSKLLPEIKPANQQTKYTPDVYRDVGKAIAVSILDSLELNPFSRIPKSTHRSLSRLEEEVGKLLYMKRSLWNYVSAAPTSAEVDSDSDDSSESTVSELPPIKPSKAGSRAIAPTKTLSNSTIPTKSKSLSRPPPIFNRSTSTISRIK